MTRRIALLLSSALTALVLILGAGIAAWLHTAGADAAPGSPSAETSVAISALRPSPDQAERDAGRQVEDRHSAGTVAGQATGSVALNPSADPAEPVVAPDRSPRLAAPARGEGAGRSIDVGTQQRPPVTAARIAGLPGDASGQTRYSPRTDGGDHDD